MPLALLAAGVAACATLNTWRGGVGNHPAALVGDWIDSARSTASDTVLWSLRANGTGEVAHVVEWPAASGVTFRRTRERYDAYWYVRGDSSHPRTGALSPPPRPGRAPADCAGFELDTIPTAGEPRHRLVVFKFEGDPTPSTQVFLERLR